MTKPRSRDVHLLIAGPPLTRTACGMFVSMLYPKTQRARAEGERTTFAYTCAPGLVTCRKCAVVMERKPDIKITSENKVNG